MNKEEEEISVIKLWYPNDLFNLKNRDDWFELVKSKKRFEVNKGSLDTNLQNVIQWVDDERLADVFVLPLDWSYYYQHKIHKFAIDFCERANSKGKVVLSCSGNDFGITVPVPDNTIVYRQSGYRSKKRQNERTAPFYLSDPVSSFLEIDEKSLFLDNSNKPVVGFCGMAPHGPVIELKEKIQILLRNIKSAIGINYFDKQEILSSSNLRFEVLETFKNSNDFRPAYIIRKYYRGGIQTPENRTRTTNEYYQNQLASDFVICVRGVGNFSVRFFETLAMGRIPIFIDTDTPLPDIGNKNWHDYIVWIDRKDILRAPEITRDWLSKRDLIEQKRKNRMLWRDYLILDQFWLRQLSIIKS